MNLNGTWQLYFAPEGTVNLASPADLPSSGLPCIPCTVPGNVELDLSAAGLLPSDLFRGMNIQEAEKYEIYEWWYVRSFTAPEAPAVDEKMLLRFGAVDCFADYYLNHEKIGQSEDMFIEQCFDVTERLRYSEENTLCVHIASASIRGANADIEPNCVAFSWHRTMSSVHVRKAPHSFGWDIMPRALSAGLWRDVTLDYEKKYGFRYVYINTMALDGDRATVKVAFTATLPPKYIYSPLTYRIHGECGSHTFTYETTYKTSACQFTFDVTGLKLWWPKGYGEPNLYDLSIEAVTPDGSVLIRKQMRRGFRTVQLNRSEIIEPGGCFDFVVNGQRIMCVGSNWVPMDVYHSRDQQRLHAALKLADDVGCNILRCWGGNVYEPQAFFDYCDEHGIMVWQDFAMACHYYPQNDEFAALLRREAEWVVSAYRDHACLVVWSGDNEIDSLSRGVDPNENRLTREVLPDVIRRLDPYRPFLPSSPYISPKAYKLGPDYYPEAHLWGPRDFYKSSFYTDSKAYFVSETGYHGCPARSSIEKFIEPEYVWPYFNNPQWNLHSTDQHNSDQRVMLMHKQVAQMFEQVPEDMDDYILASQISQAEAKKFFIERVRCQMSRMGGVIWWNLIDGWPQMSDAVVDYYYTRKLAYDYIKRSSAPFMIMVGELDAWGHPVIAANSTLRTQRGHVRVADLSTDRVLLDTDFVVTPNCNALLGQFDMFRTKKGMLKITWSLENGETGMNSYLYGTAPYSLEHYKQWLKALTD